MFGSIIALALLVAGILSPVLIPATVAAFHHKDRRGQQPENSKPSRVLTAEAA